MAPTATTEPTLFVSLDLDSAVQHRFEYHRMERVRKGSRMVWTDRMDHAWTEYGRAHFHCAATMIWKDDEIGVWLKLEVPLESPPGEGLPKDAVRNLVDSYAHEIDQAISSFPFGDPPNAITIRVSGQPAGQKSGRLGGVRVSELAAANLDAWTLRLRKAKAEFDRARRLLLEIVTEHCSYYDDVASELRAAARLIDQVERSDASPHQWMRDCLHADIERHLNDLLARKMTHAHGFKVAFHHVHSGAYNATFPIFWRDWPPI